MPDVDWLRYILMEDWDWLIRSPFGESELGLATEGANSAISCWVLNYSFINGICWCIIHTSVMIGYYTERYFFVGKSSTVNNFYISSPTSVLCKTCYSNAMPVKQ